MTHNDDAGAAPTEPAPAPSLDARGIDGQIVAIWQALRVNPDLDARCALAAIDNLLDRRARPAAPVPAAATKPSEILPPGSPVQQAVLSSILSVLALPSGT